MLFSDILGLDHLKSHLTTSVDRGRIPHAQLFVGSNGSGTLPMAVAYAQYVLCNTGKGDRESCAKKFSKLAHPDLHFAYPVSNNKRVKSKARSADFIKEWREFVLDNPYGSLFDWYQHLGIENKQGKIGIDDARDIAKTLNLKSYEGGFKAMIIWRPELLNIAAANHLLKLIEEPPEKTIFILLAEDEGQVLQTIRSRCQKLEFPPLPENDIKIGLRQKNLELSEAEAQKIAFRADGNFAKALQILNRDESDQQFEQWFVDLVRTAFKAKGNKASVLKLLKWVDTVAGTNRETQKRFLIFCSNLFRQALMANYKADKLVLTEPSVKGFELKKFAPFVHGNNINDLHQEVENAIYHIERNGNSKIILTDLSIKLTRLLHRKR